MSKLENKVAVVTGASKGIGAAIAKHFAAAGAKVVVNYASSKEGADKVVKEITNNGGIAIAVLNQGVRPFLTKWHPQLLVHEAGRAPSKAPQEWEREWSQETRARGELQALTDKLQAFAASLAKMAGVRS